MAVVDIGTVLVVLGLTWLSHRTHGASLTSCYTGQKVGSRTLAALIKPYLMGVGTTYPDRESPGPGEGTGAEFAAGF